MTNHDKLKARRELEQKRQQKKIEILERRIVEYDEKIMKDQKISGDNSYNLIGKILLIASVIILVLGLVLAVSGSGINTAIIAMIITLVTLAISIAAQSTPMLAEKRIRENAAKQKQTRLALSELKNRH